MSYAHPDSDLAAALADRLEREYQHQVWFDSGIPAGVKWWDEILDHIESSDCFMAIMTASFNESIHCHAELSYAVALSKAMLPLKMTGVILPTIKPIQCV